VSDTGIGIKPECQEKIFERFHQADVTVRENYGGTGLGLSIVKEFVTLLGGQMRLESQEGCGATFFYPSAKFDNRKG
jgi:signal transduction histidine kinase